MTTKTLISPLKAWMIAIRVQTLLIPTTQVITATAIAYISLGALDWILAFYALIASLTITIGTNLINDAIDYEKGLDTIGRAKSLKVISANLLSQREVFLAGIFAFLIACSIPFALNVDKAYCFFFIITSVIAGYCYTGGPFPISYLGLSELFVFIFYGGVCILVPFFAQTHFLSLPIILGACQLGLLAILPNALNNFRDFYDDAKANKKTLAVRFGIDFAKKEIQVLTILPFVLGLGWIFLGYPEASLMPLLLVPIAFIFLKGLMLQKPTNQLGTYFKLSLMIHFCFGVLLIIGLLIG